MIEIPLRSDVPWYDQKCEIDSITYTMTFHWNERASLWVMDIATNDEEMIISGIPLLCNVDLLGRFQDERLPQGMMFCYDQTETGQDPDATNVNIDVFLLYAGADEL
jgi:hypothetical protein